MHKDIKNRRQPCGRTAGLAVACLLVLAAALAPGCTPVPDMKKLEQEARREQQRQRLTPEMMRPQSLVPYSGPFPGAQDIPAPGFSLSVPDGGWYWNKGGLFAPGAAAVFVHGDTDPFDIVVAVAPDRPPLAWPGDPGRESATPDAPAPGAARAVTDYFKEWNREFQPAASEEQPDAHPARAVVRGFLAVPTGGRGPGAPPHDAAVVYAYRQPDANTTLLVFTYPEIYQDRLQIYIDEILSHFKLQ